MYILPFSPWKFLFPCIQALGQTSETVGGCGGRVWPESGEETHRRRGLGGGKGRGARGEPADGVGWGWEGRRWPVHGERRPVAMACRGGGVPAREER